MKTQYRPGNALTLGTTPEGEIIRLSADDRTRHFYVPGATRAGKSKFLENLIRQDILNWRKSRCPVVVLDPHGALYRSVLAWLARHALDLPEDLPVTLIDPCQDWVVGYNPLRPRPEVEVSVTVQAMVTAVAHAFRQADTIETPRFATEAQYLFHALHDLRLTLVEADYFMAGSLDADEARVRRALIARLRKPEVRRHLEETSTEARERPGDFRTRTESTTNRLRPFVANDRMKCMFGQVNSLDWGEVLNEGGIVLCNISQDDARLYEEDTRVLGSTILHDLWHAARARRKDANHPTAYLYLDEFQEFVSPTVAKELSQSAGFGLSLTLAHQFPTQLLNEGRDGKATYDAVLGNAQNKAVFHMEHPADLAMLAEVLFLSIFNPKKILLALNSIKVVGYREVTREVMIPRQPAVFAKSYPGRRSDILLR